MFFDRQISFQETSLRILGNRHEGYPLVHIAEIGIESEFQLARDLALLLTKLRRERVKDCIFDPPVQIVDVGLFHALTQALTLLLQAGHGGIMIVTHFGKVLAQRADEPAEHAVRHFDPVEHVRELLQQHLFPNIWLTAFLLRVAAPVVDIFLLLYVAHEKAAAVATLDHAGEQEILLDAANARSVTTIEDTLDTFPQLG